MPEILPARVRDVCDSVRRGRRAEAGTTGDALHRVQQAAPQPAFLPQLRRGVLLGGVRQAPHADVSVAGAHCGTEQPLDDPDRLRQHYDLLAGAGLLRRCTQAGRRRLTCDAQERAADQARGGQVSREGKKGKTKEKTKGKRQKKTKRQQGSRLASPTNRIHDAGKEKGVGTRPSEVMSTRAAR